MKSTPAVAPTIPITVEQQGEVEIVATPLDEAGVFEVTVTFQDKQPSKSVLLTSPREFAFQTMK